jgi:hypothetical protein
MEKEKFDKLMSLHGWTPKGNGPMELLATDNPDANLKGIDSAHKYSHKAGFTICVDDKEIASVVDDKFDDWLEKSSQPYIASRLYSFAGGSRYKSEDGEYINAYVYSKKHMELKIERLTQQDDYILKERKKVFDWRRFKFIHKALFFKPKPIIQS